MHLCAITKPVAKEQLLIQLGAREGFWEYVHLSRVVIEEELAARTRWGGQEQFGQRCGGIRIKRAQVTAVSDMARERQQSIVGKDKPRNRQGPAHERRCCPATEFEFFLQVRGNHL